MKRVYDAALIEKILKRLAAGETLRRICRDEGMPRESTFRSWVLDDKNGLAERYARARDLGMDSMVDEMLEIADDSSKDITPMDLGDGVVVEHVNHEHINRSKLRIDARKWYLSKLAPKKYGERLEHAFDEKTPLTIVVKRLDSPHAETPVVGNGPGRTSAGLVVEPDVAGTQE